MGYLDNVHEITYGPVRPEMICPHCQVKGKVRTTPIKRKRGLSGGKVVVGSPHRRHFHPCNRAVTQGASHTGLLRQLWRNLGLLILGDME